MEGELPHCFDSMAASAIKDGKIFGEYGSKYDLSTLCFTDPNTQTNLTLNQIKNRHGWIETEGESVICDTCITQMIEYKEIKIERSLSDIYGMYEK